MENFKINKNLENRNIIQIMLAERHGESIEDFISKHSEDFGNTVESHPEFLDEFETDKEKALKDIEGIIYH